MQNKFLLKCVCAGISVFPSDVETSDLAETLENIKQKLKEGKLHISFGWGQYLVATEVCIDVYDKVTKMYRHDLSVAYKK